MSLIPMSRLSIDSPRSPTVAVRRMASPSSSPFQTVPSVEQQRDEDAAGEHAGHAEPTRPSQDLPGEMAGAILCRPPDSTPAA